MKKVLLGSPAFLWAPALLATLAVGLGCGKPSPDSSQVLANVGGQKITQKEFEDTVRSVVPDSAKAEEVLHSDAMHDQRNGFLGSLAQQKAALELARMEGVDKDPKVRLAVEGAVAQVYLKAILDKRSAPVAPSEADLKKLYDSVVAKQASSGNSQPPPPFDSVKDTLTQMWRQQQEQQNQERLQTQLFKELKERIPVTYAEDYQPKQTTGN